MVKKDYAAAAKYFMQAIRRDPKKASRYRNAALTLEQVKQYKKALKYATKYAEMETNAASREQVYAYRERLKEMTDR